MSVWAYYGMVDENSAREKIVNISIFLFSALKFLFNNEQFKARESW